MAPVRARNRRSTLAFAIVTAAIATVMILGLVALQALLAQVSFRIDDLQAAVNRQTQVNEHLTLEAARLQSPGRIAAAARSIGLVLPSGGVQVLHLPDDGRRRPHAGAGAGVTP